MATVRKPASGKWNTQIRRKRHPTISKFFIAQKDAYIWIRNIESDMDKGIFINPSGAENTTLAEALIRYRNEVTPSKKGISRELEQITMWIKHPLSKRSLSSLKSTDFAKYRDVRLKEVAPGTAKLELALISHLFTIAKKEWGIPIDNPPSNIEGVLDPV
ncbi:hypothetical protein [Nitrosomonas sp. Nm132]|jgi:hypothetical protein|uniref:hypothetical protein n=1 Tax=Nitrosomonas sp. Nm132 TaxID=1881053 RepID=UPI00088B5C8A|nr:hypothetical protein [Nitrosomonas sp. Nm132]SDH83732.1 hypothetical protein SAMN05428952_103528 [Nitrosomonas sp. Nm132]